MSKIEVNTITQQCGPTLTVGGGACKSVTVDATTVTLGKSGGTVSLAAGATQSGFGRTGTVDWCTTAKTAPFTGVNGKGYFVNTTSGAITVTLPASPSAGDIISLKDYGSTWQTNNVTLCGNGSKINGVCGTSTLNTQSQSVTLIYVDATKGWQDIHDSTSNVSAAAYITATGGTITTSGDYKIHTFTSDGTFCVSAGGGNLAVADYLVVAGGGGGGNSGPSGSGNGGGGAGGFRESHVVATSGCYTASPLASATSLPISVQAYPVVVGGGGSGIGPTPAYTPGTQGSNSVFSTITSAGGGGGGSGDGGTPATAPTLSDGGSGGGSGYRGAGGSGNTPSVTPPQGKDGGSFPGPSPGPPYAASGGGGATVAGSAFASASTGGAGGNGATTSISTTPTTYAGGGGGSGGFNIGSGRTGGAGGSGGGGAGNSDSPSCGTSGTANTGGGGGGAGGSTSGSGGSGIVIIRYKFQ